MCLDVQNVQERTLVEGEHMGFAYQIVHNTMGYRCGYIRVDEAHPWYDKAYDDLDVRVHGGLTYVGKGKACPTHDDKAEQWFGFDCGHAWDAADLNLLTFDDLERKVKWAREFSQMHPQYGPPQINPSDAVVRDTEYVIAQCKSLCEQAAQATA